MFVLSIINITNIINQYVELLCIFALTKHAPGSHNHIANIAVYSTSFSSTQPHSKLEPGNIPLYGFALPSSVVTTTFIHKIQKQTFGLQLGKIAIDGQIVKMLVIKQQFQELRR